MNLNDDTNALIEKIRTNTGDGAGELARQAVLVMKITAEKSTVDNARDFLLEQKEAGKRLIAARRTMAPISNIITRLLRDVIREGKTDDLETARRRAIETADALYTASLNAVGAISRYTADMVNDHDIILTHSYSSTIIAALKEAADRHNDVKVIVTRSGPGGYGEKTAAGLTGDGIPVMFIDDTAAGVYISRVNRVLVGADRICPDRKLINGIGTRQVAVLAAESGIPFYVLCETLKLDFSLNSDKVDLEDRGADAYPEPLSLPDGVKISSPAFDITPLELVTALVTEEGVIDIETLFSQ